MPNGTEVNGTEVGGEVIGGSPPTSQKSRRFVFTYYPKTDEDTIYAEDEMQYCYYGEELCPTTGRKHHQGWCIFFNPRSEKAVCKKYACWMRVMKGTYTQNYKYCSKDRIIKEYGQAPEQGKRSDLLVIVDELKQKKTSIESILLNDPMMYHTYGRTLEKIQHTMYLERSTQPTVYWFYGPAGSGKTRKAVSIDPDYYIKDPSTKWWNNYKQQHTIILDDFRRDDMTLANLLRITDRYKCDVEYKGGVIPLNSPVIVITCDEGPHSYWQGNDLAQIKRRLTNIEYIK